MSIIFNHGKYEVTNTYGGVIFRTVIEQLAIEFIKKFSINLLEKWNDKCNDF